MIQHAHTYGGEGRGPKFRNSSRALHVSYQKSRDLYWHGNSFFITKTCAARYLLR